MTLLGMSLDADDDVVALDGGTELEDGDDEADEEENDPISPKRCPAFEAAPAEEGEAEPEVIAVVVVIAVSPKPELPRFPFLISTGLIN
jgi:hypothetical protein